MIDFEEQENSLICRFGGNLNSDVCVMIESDLAGKIGPFLKNHDRGTLVFDLAGTRHVSSVFFRICLLYSKAAGSANFVIRNVSEDVYTVFRLTGFTEIMHIDLA